MRVLIVEDEVLVAMMLTDSLESGGGCPEHGYTGREARRMVPDLPPRAP
jgi:DNA-binding response OmpR family regulator